MVAHALGQPNGHIGSLCGTVAWLESGVVGSITTVFWPARRVSESARKVKLEGWVS